MKFFNNQGKILLPPSTSRQPAWRNYSHFAE